MNYDAWKLSNPYDTNEYQYHCSDCDAVLLLREKDAIQCEYCASYIVEYLELGKRRKDDK